MKKAIIFIVVIGLAVTGYFLLNNKSGKMDLKSMGLEESAVLEGETIKKDGCFAVVFTADVLHPVYHELKEYERYKSSSYGMYHALKYYTDKAAYVAVKRDGAYVYVVGCNLHEEDYYTPSQYSTNANSTILYDVSGVFLLPDEYRSDEIHLIMVRENMTEIADQVLGEVPIPYDVMKAAGIVETPEKRQEVQEQIDRKRAEDILALPLDALFSKENIWFDRVVK